MKKSSLKNEEPHEEILALMFEVAKQTDRIGKQDESLKKYEEIYGNFDILILFFIKVEKKNTIYTKVRGFIFHK